MKHPFIALKPEYSQLLQAMVVRPECRNLVDEVAVKLCGYKPRYEALSAKDGVPILFIAASFEREASSDFNLSPAQGDPWRRVSKHVPKGRGPFQSWLAAGLDAYHINGLDQIGAPNWTWETMCYYGELFNGFGYRDFHHMHSPYLWGGTNIQTVGKYDSDGQFNPSHMDPQLGIVPVMKRMVEIDPALNLSTVIPPPMPSGIAVTNDVTHDTKWVQASLNTLGHEPALDVDGSYGRETMYAVMDFQTGYDLTIDGLAGPDTIAAIVKALAA